MSEYKLYLESGPRRKKTMVHVLDLLGCVALGPTTDEALDATPEAIRAYLRFLQAHGESADPKRSFTTVVAQHVTEGNWIGNGDPVSGFDPDFEPLTADQLATHLRRLEWLGGEMQAEIRRVRPEQMSADPESGGRPILRIVEHVAESQGAYLRYTVGRVEGLNEALRSVQGSPVEVAGAIAQLWKISLDRLGTLSDDERNRVVPHGRLSWTARRGVRRMLEHAWEHLLEIRRRSDTADSTEASRVGPPRESA